MKMKKLRVPKGGSTQRQMEKGRRTTGSSFRCNVASCARRPPGLSWHFCRRKEWSDPIDTHDLVLLCRAAKASSSDSGGLRDGH